MNFKSLEKLLGDLTHKGARVFSQIMTAVDQQAVIDKGVVLKDSAFIVPMSEEATGGEVHTIQHSQDINVTIGVMYGIRSLNDAYGANVNQRLTTIKQATRNAIAGYELDDDHEPFNFVRGEVVAYLKGGVFWMDIFSTTYRFTKE